MPTGNGRQHRPILPSKPLGLDDVLIERDSLWQRVDEIAETFEVVDTEAAAAAAALAQLKQLKKLHAICKAREAHVQKIKLGLMQERNEYLSKLVEIQRYLAAAGHISGMDPAAQSTLGKLLHKVKSKLP
ncbi:Aste57867_14338 [Aphanomyces stellatus]|uniref:Aste57867_14338 protein n=1 Tax=Aphanomyces stellatus TaxID=120398 RepID=A0A485L0D5_9STRA|nr:hypothetical protein As57867_014284 [Aphanomyces stellatus]VFT91162.1 Aste57867_14338 [Aphanomyces stellatus]